MATAAQGADDAATLGKIKVKVQAEFWIDPLDHVPLEERRAMLLTGRQMESRGGFPMCGVDTAPKQVTPLVLLEIFMNELSHALKPSSMHGHQKQIITESSPQYDLKNGQSSRGQIYDGTFADGRSAEIKNNGVVINFEPVPMSSNVAVNTDDRHSHEERRSEDSQPNVCQHSCLVPCSGDKNPSTGQRDAGAGCDDMVFSSPDHTIKVKGMSENVFSFPKDNIKEHGADKLNGHDNVGIEFPLEKCVNGSSVVNAVEHIYISMNGIPKSSVASFPCMSVQHTQRTEECIGINSDGTSGAGRIAAVAGLPALSSLKANKQLSDSILSTDPVRVKYKVGDKCYLPEGSAAKCICHSISFFPENCAQKHANEVLSDVCVDYISCGNSNLPEKEVQSPAVGQKEREFKTDCLLHDSSLSTSSVMVKVEPADEVADAQLSEINTLRESCWLHPGPNTRGTLQAFICQENIPFVVHNLQKNHEHGGTCSHESFTNCLKVPLMAERDRNFGTGGQLCVSALSHSSYRMPEDVPVALQGEDCSNSGNQSADGAFSFSPGRVKVEPPEEIHAVCSYEATTVSQFNPSTFNPLNKFVRDPCQATLSGTCNMQTIREGDTVSSDNISINVPAGKNLRDVLPDSIVSAFPDIVKTETLEGNHAGIVSETVATVNFSLSASGSSDEAAGMSTCTVLSTFPMRVKDEALEEDHVVGDSESMPEKDSGLSILHSPVNAVVLNTLPDMICSSKSIDCQGDSPSRVCNVQNDQETIMSSSQLNIPEDTGIVTGQKQTCLGNWHIDSDVLASKGIKHVEQLDKSCANIFSENTVRGSNSSCSSSNLIPKAEPIEYVIQNSCSNPLGTFPSSDMLLVEAKSEIVGEVSVDILDHMPLTERTKMLAFSMVSELKPARKSRCFKQTRVHAVGLDSVDSIKIKAKGGTIRRKRKRTATDLVEVALEEDAPGLLQGLLDRGINLDEIKLYGCEEDVDPLDISSNVDSFEDLEAVISKLFSERPTSLFKLAPLRHVKGTKAVYCLACLISLIEQTRYLQFRNRPVEWGWCRDLQSFIFVFKMHNRIVLERPEYGYATYFFELVQSFPIEWQIKRLVTAMKLTCCSRATLIENKSLLVGVDLSEGEARVLEEYGWLPNTGLGSMLNYCDRVVHDRNERDVSEWRTKIGKLLMDGYDGGRIVKVDLPKKVMDYVGGHFPEIKMET